MSTDDASESSSSLRLRAEEQLRKRSRAGRAQNPSPEPDRLLQELQIQQIELEMQNEELRQAQAEVEAGLERYTDLYDFAPVGYFTLDAYGEITQANVAGAKLLGWERTELGEGAKFAWFVAAADRGEFAKCLAQAQERTDGPATCEVALEKTRSSTPQRFVRLDATASGPPLTWRLTVVDITDRKLTEEALRQAHDELEARVRARTAELQAANDALAEEVSQRQRTERELETALAREQAARQQLVQVEKLGALGRMVGAVAHELNNPLQTVANCFYLMGQDLAPDSPLHEPLSMAQDETRRLRKLVAQLRDLYRMQPGGTPEACSLLALLLEVRTLMAESLQDGRVQWRQAPRVPDRWVNANPDRLKQVFSNIVSNALEVMAPGGGDLQVDLALSADGREVGVGFRDSGPGIRPEQMGRLFEPFFTTKDHGLGLGLAICHELVQQHGGHIAVSSVLGHGAQFTVWLPLLVPPTDL